MYQIFVEIEEPYCTDVSPYTLEYSTVCHGCFFDSVPTAKLPEIEPLYRKTLNSIVEKGIDLNRMKDLIERSILKHYNAMEERPHDMIQVSIYSTYYIDLDIVTEIITDAIQIGIIFIISFILSKREQQLDFFYTGITVPRANSNNTSR